MNVNEVSEISATKSAIIKIIFALCVVGIIIGIGFSIKNYREYDKYIYRDFISEFNDKAPIIYTEDKLESLEENDHCFLMLEDCYCTDGHLFGYLKDKNGDDTDIMIRLTMPFVYTWQDEFSDNMIVYGSFIRKNKEKVDGDRETYYQFNCNSFAEAGKTGASDIFYCTRDNYNNFEIGEKVSMMMAISKDLKEVQYDGSDYLIVNPLISKDDIKKDEFSYKRSDEKFIIVDDDIYFTGVQVKCENEFLNKMHKFILSVSGVMVLNYTVTDVQDGIYVLEAKDQGKYLEMCINDEKSKLKEEDVATFAEDGFDNYVDNLFSENDMLNGSDYDIEDLKNILFGTEKEGIAALKKYTNLLEVEEPEEEEVSEQEVPEQEDLTFDSYSGYGTYLFVPTNFQTEASYYGYLWLTTDYLNGGDPLTECAAWIDSDTNAIKTFDTYEVYNSWEDGIEIGVSNFADVDL